MLGCILVRQLDRLVDTSHHGAAAPRVERRARNGSSLQQRKLPLDLTPDGLRNCV